MAGNILIQPSNPIVSPDDWTRMLSIFNRFKPGSLCINLNNWTEGNTVKPRISRGSFIEISGKIVRFNSDTSITNPLSTGTNYIRVLISDDHVEVDFTSVAPTWNRTLNGWYDSVNTNIRYTGHVVTYNGTTYTNKKTIIDTEGLLFHYVGQRTYMNPTTVQATTFAGATTSTLGVMVNPFDGNMYTSHVNTFMQHNGISSSILQTKTIHSSVTAAQDITFNPLNGDILVSCNGTKKIYVYDYATLTLQTSFDWPDLSSASYPHTSIAVDRDGNLLFVQNDSAVDKLYFCAGISNTVLSSVNITPAGTNGYTKIAIDTVNNNLWSRRYAPTVSIQIHKGLDYSQVRGTLAYHTDWYLDSIAYIQSTGGLATIHVGTTDYIYVTTGDVITYYE